MPNPDTGLRLSKWRMTYIFALVSVLAGVSSYGWYIYTLVREAERNKPKPQIEKLLKDLLAYQQQTKQFPASFSELNARLWHTVPTPNYGKEGREAYTKNYYYRYTKVNAESCTLWALPTGSQRQYAAAFFVVITPGWARAWQGKVQGEHIPTNLPVLPSQQMLTEMGMEELPARIFKTTVN